MTQGSTQALAKTEADQPVNLTKGDVERLINMGLERGRSEAIQMSNGRQTMGINEAKAWAALIRAAGAIQKDKGNAQTPDHVLEARAIFKMMAGLNWGIQPFESQSLFHFIPASGTVVPDYKALMMRIRLSGIYDYQIVELTDETCTVRAFAIVNGQRRPLEPDVTFTKKEAINAGLYNEKRAKGDEKYPDGNVKAKGAWEAYTKDMLLARTINRLFKRHFPDLYSSIPSGTKEDYDDAEAVKNAPPQQIATTREEDQPFSETFSESSDYIDVSDAPPFTPVDPAESRRADLITAAQDWLKGQVGDDPEEIKKFMKGKSFDSMTDDELRTFGSPE